MKTYSALFDIPGVAIIVIVIGSIAWVVWTVGGYRRAWEDYGRQEMEWRRFRDRKLTERLCPDRSVPLTNERG